MPKGALLFYIFGLALIGLQGKRIPSFAGPYKVIVQRVTNLSDDFHSTGEIWARLYFSHHRRQQQYVYGMTHLLTEINDDMKLDISLALWANNQWKKNAFVMKFDRACTSFLKHAQSIIDFAYGVGKKCPILPAGHIQQKNRTWEFKFPSFPVLPYGRYLFTLAILKVDKAVGVVVADCELVPKV